MTLFWLFMLLRKFLQFLSGIIASKDVTSPKEHLYILFSKVRFIACLDVSDRVRNSPKLCWGFTPQTHISYFGLKLGVTKRVLCFRFLFSALCSKVQKAPPQVLTCSAQTWIPWVTISQTQILKVSYPCSPK